MIEPEVRNYDRSGNKVDLVIMKTGEEVTIPHLLRTSHDINTYELILAEVKSFIQNAR